MYLNELNYDLFQRVYFFYFVSTVFIRFHIIN
jgi:hypothetical protein